MVHLPCFSTSPNNNHNDPCVESNDGVHSMMFELGVLALFSHLWELETGEYWGYIANYGTEGNLHGILIGREVFPDGILYAFSESHWLFSIQSRMEYQGGRPFSGEIFSNQVSPGSFNVQRQEALPWASCVLETNLFFF